MFSSILLITTNIAKTFCNHTSEMTFFYKFQFNTYYEETFEFIIEFE